MASKKLVGCIKLLITEIIVSMQAEMKPNRILIIFCFKNSVAFVEIYYTVGNTEVI